MTTEITTVPLTLNQPSVSLSSQYSQSKENKVSLPRMQSFIPPENLHPASFITDSNPLLQSSYSLIIINHINILFN